MSHLPYKSRYRRHLDPMRTNPVRALSKVERDEAEARRTYEDYEEMAALGVYTARKNPKLAEALRAASNMALAAYTIGREVSGLAPLLSPAELRAKQRAEAEAAQAARAVEEERRREERRLRLEAEQREREERAATEAAEASAAAFVAAQRVATDNPALKERFSGLDFDDFDFEVSEVSEGASVQSPEGST